MCDASCCRPSVFTEHRRDLAPTVEPAQPDWPTDHEAEEQNQRGILSGQRALGLHASSELLVQALDHVGRAQRLPLALGELEEGEQLLATLLQGADHAGAAGPPLPLEAREGTAGRWEALGVYDPVEVGAEFGQGVLRCLALKVAQLVDVMPTSA